MAPLGRISIFNRPPDIRSTLDANLLNSSKWGVPVGFALCSFHRNCACWALAGAGAIATPAASPAPAVFRNFLRFMGFSSC
jgi:hypothetical protein